MVGLNYSQNRISVIRRVQQSRTVKSQFSIMRSTQWMKQSLKQTLTLCDLFNCEVSRVPNWPEHYGTRGSKLPGAWRVCAKSRLHWWTPKIHLSRYAVLWGWEKNLTVHNVTCHVNSVKKLQPTFDQIHHTLHKDKMETHHGKHGRTGSYTKGMKSIKSTSITSSRMDSSSSRSSPTIMQIWHHYIAQVDPHSYWPPSSVTSVHDLPYCCFSSAPNHARMQCPAFLMDLCVIPILLREASVLSIWRRRGWSQPKQYCGSFGANGREVRAGTLEKIIWLEYPIPAQQHNQLTNHHGLKWACNQTAYE